VQRMGLDHFAELIDLLPADKSEFLSAVRKKKELQ